MAKLDPARGGAGPQITGFAGDGFRIDGVAYGGALLTPDWVRAWPAHDVAALTAADLAELVAIGPEFILLGTGATLRRPAAAVVVALEAQGVGIEAMDSKAAARAWGVLRAEGRWIAAALMRHPRS